MTAVSPLRLAAVLSPLLNLAAHAQAPAQTLSPELLQTLDRLAGSAADYKASVPNFTCNETIRSDASRGGKVRQHAEGTARFRVVRGAPGDWPADSRTMLTFNGHPVPPQMEPRFPVTLLGGFARPLELYFNPSHRACFRYSASARRVDFAAAPQVAYQQECEGVAPQSRGFVLLDPVTGGVTHLERTVPEGVAAAGSYAAFITIDYTTLPLNGHIFRLPTAIRATQHYSQQDLTFEAHYSACQLYTGSSRILGVEPAEPQR